MSSLSLLPRNLPALKHVNLRNVSRRILLPRVPRVGQLRGVEEGERAVNTLSTIETPSTNTCLGWGCVIGAIHLRPKRVRILLLVYGLWFMVYGLGFRV